MKTSFRLDKYLADMSVGTRSEVKNLIKKRTGDGEWRSHQKA